MKRLIVALALACALTLPSAAAAKPGPALQTADQFTQHLVHREWTKACKQFAVATYQALGAVNADGTPKLGQCAAELKANVPSLYSMTRQSSVYDKATGLIRVTYRVHDKTGVPPTRYPIVVSVGRESGVWRVFEVGAS
jgi:hypothetical protein